MLYLSVLILVSGTFGCEGKCCSNSLGYDIVGSDYVKKKENIWRPCDLDNYDCMRRFLAANSQCRPAPEYRPDPIYLPVERFQLPSSRMTITHIDAIVTGFSNAKIIEYYVNKGTGNLVIGILMPLFNLTSNAYHTYHRTAKEAISKGDYTTFTVANVIFTLTIPKIPYLRLDMADIHADTHNAGPKAYYIGSKAFRSRDPDVKAEFSAMIRNLGAAVREVFTYHAYLLCTIFVQTELCDFGFDSYQNFDGYFIGKCYYETAK